MELTELVFFIIVILFSAIIHEYSHGYMADRLGDPTARYAGRLTLNPIPHLDLFGSILMPLFLLALNAGFLFAYAKPVPYNPYNLKNQKWGPAMVAIAGPLSNILLAIVFGIIVQLTGNTPYLPYLSVIVYANVLLAIFNLVPIPPLDGSKVVFAVLPPQFDNIRAVLERFGFILLLLFVFVFFRLISPIIFWLYDLLTGGYGVL